MPEPEAIVETSAYQNEGMRSVGPVMTFQLPAPPSAAHALAATLAEWGEKRKVFVEFLRQNLIKGVDYGPVHFSKDCTSFKQRRECSVPGHWSKDTLFKSGGEKCSGFMGLRPVFRKDEDTWEMIGRPAGVICLVCDLLTPSGEVAGEGRGCRDIQKDFGDVNKSIKMAQKSSQLDAVLRTGGLSDVFTLDLEDEEEKPDTKPAPKPDTHHPPPAPVATPANLQYQALSTQIMACLKRDGFAGRALEDYEAEVFSRTGLELKRENYEAILSHLATSTGTL